MKKKGAEDKPVYQGKLKIHKRDLNERQEFILNLMLTKDTRIVFVDGVAGTSKTYLATLASLLLVSSGKCSSIKYIRSAVECAASRIGFLPGTVEDKIDGYLEPLMDKLNELMAKDDYVTLMASGKITGHPVSFLRGLNWRSSAIIVDEAQNLTRKELLTIMTRISDHSKMFIVGDSMQEDIKDSGFREVTSMFHNGQSHDKGIHCIGLTNKDIVRDGIVQYIIETFQSYKK